MKIIKSIAEFRKMKKSLSGDLGFVPTMGYLHDGHTSLVKLAQKDNDFTAVSIFVNPMQFAPNEDFQKYPRNTEKDLLLLESVNTDIVFLPTTEELYPHGFETAIRLNEITTKLEGAIRPEHFTGVATVLTKLFNIIQPTHAYFGQKDAQQVAVVKKMVKDLNFPLEIIVGKTIRESDGLAMSSRNVFLSETERKEAAILYESLCKAKELFEKGETNTKQLKIAMKNLIQKTSGDIDYISIADTQTLNEIESIDNDALISLAVRFGSTRLIDNIIIGK